MPQAEIRPILLDCMQIVPGLAIITNPAISPVWATSTSSVYLVVLYHTRQGYYLPCLERQAKPGNLIKISHRPWQMKARLQSVSTCHHPNLSKVAYWRQLFPNIKNRRLDPQPEQLFVSKTLNR
jgi:hypothetical protein